MIDSETLHNIASGRLAPPDMVSLVIPHYETAELVRLCLRAVRRYTTVPFEALVVDNASTDGESLAYLRRVSWIRLIERPAAEVPQAAPLAHASAVSLGLREARGPLVLVMHTDTIARCEGWLRTLAAPFEADERLAVVGADKIDAPGPLWGLLKAAADGKTWRRLARRVTGRPLPEALRPREPHARSFCALYRRAALEREGLDFMPTGGRTAGEDLYRELLARGYHARLLGARQMRHLVAHVVHATAQLSPGRTITTGRVRRRTARRLERLFGSDWVAALRQDDSLDTR